MCSGRPAVLTHKFRMLLFAALLLSTLHASAAVEAIYFKNINGDWLDIFYRETGPQHAPIFVLLHGRQTSSHMYRDLIPILSTRYRVIAPDLPGFGQSGTPSITEFAYTFDNLARTIEHFLKAVDAEQYSLL